MCIGEGQIARHVNAAWQQARAAGATGPVLDSLLQRALAVRRHVRKTTAIAECFVSTAQATVELAGNLFGSLAKRRALLIGAGRMSEAVAHSLVRQGASVCVVNRTDQNAIRLARRVGAQACTYDVRERLLLSADLVIGAMAASEPIITSSEVREVARERQHRNLVLIDLGLPRNVDPAVRNVSGMLLYDLDDLERAQGHRSQVWEAEVEAEKIILAEAHAFHKELIGEAAIPAITDLRHRLDEICQQELDSFRLEQGPFPKDQDQLIAAVSTRITHKIAGTLARKTGARL